MKKSEWAVIGAGAGAAALGAETYRRARRDLGTARARLLAGSQIVETAAGPIEFTQGGEGQPVLVVHGAGGGYDQGQALAEIAGDGWRWLAVSRFGYLRTPLPADASPEAQGEAHAALLDALKIDRAAVVAASAGGPSGLHFAIRHPERCRALVLVSAVTRPLTIRRSVRWVRRAFGRSDWAAWLITRIERRTQIGAGSVPGDLRRRLTDEDRLWLQGFVTAFNPASLRRAGIANDVAWLPAFSPIPLDRVLAPTLIVHAADDPLVPVANGRHAATGIRGARYVELPDGGHLLLGHQQEAAAIVRAFLAPHDN
jgi:pimeloyl-ACP methyl ester carboxylesterase